MITVALPKGSLLKESIRLFKSVGLDFSGFLDSSHRQLQLADSSGQAKGLLVRAQGRSGLCRVRAGASRHCWLRCTARKKQPKVAHLTDLGFGGCHLSVAVESNSGYQSAVELPPHCRVASKFVNSARQYFQSLDLPVEIVPLSGSVELGPITGHVRSHCGFSFDR